MTRVTGSLSASTDAGTLIDEVALVVSTTIGAEGLDVTDGRDIRIADTPAAFAECCAELLEDAEGRRRMAQEAHTMVADRYSWQVVTNIFERYLWP